MKQTLSQIIIATALLSGSLNAAAEITIKTPEEKIAINHALLATGGSGEIVSTDKDWTNWDVNIIKGCVYFQIEVSHETRQVTSRKQTNYCDNPEKLRKLRQKAREYARTHR